MNLNLTRPRALRRGLRVAAGVAALVLAATTLAACGDDEETPSSGGTTKMTVTYFEGTDVSLPVVVADKEGFFKEQGLDVSLLATKDGPTAVAALQSGDADLALNQTEGLMIARDKGLDLKAVVGDVAIDALQVIGTSAPGTDAAASLKAMKGKKVGVPVIGGVPELQLRHALGDAGMSGDDVTFVAVGNLPAGVIAALKAGQVDYFVGVEPVPTLAVDVQKIANRVLAFKDLPGFEPWLFNEYVGIGDKLDAKAETIEKFVAAYKKAIAFMKDSANREGLVALASEFLSLEPDLTAQLLDKVVPNFDAELNAEAIANVSSFLVGQKAIQKEISADDYIWTR